MPLLIAHRGASSEAPENTLASIKRALETGVDYVEIDVHLSADGHAVVIHDAIVGRTAWGAAGKRISEMPLAEIQSLDAGSWFGKPFAGEKIPTLNELLHSDLGTTGVMIEVKHEDSPIEPLAAAIVEAFHNAPKHGPLIVGSFSLPLLEVIQKLSPEISLMGIVEKRFRLSSFDALKPKRMAIWYKLATPELVSIFHDAGQEVWTFTVDDQTTARFLISIGVDGIISNKPRELKALFSPPFSSDRV